VTPKASVLIPARNAARLLPDAIASVRRQAFPCEVVVVDDGSTDRTVEVADRLADLVIRQPPRGVAAARNAALAAARLPLVAFIDADDIWTDAKLALQQRLLHASGDLLVLGHTVFRARHATGWTDHLRPQLLFSLGAALIHREAFDRIGLFDETLRFSEDVDWFLRLRDTRAPFHVHRDVVQYTRRHGANMTRGLDARSLQLLEVLKRSLDRRREGVVHVS
jgi:glycosyltransferase involved in cell wall biosynthesis